jgi:hypothetical protein
LSISARGSRNVGVAYNARGRQSLAALPLVQTGKVESSKKEEHKANFEKHKCRDKKVAHHQTYELNYKTTSGYSK